MQLLLTKNELLDLGNDLHLVSIHCQEGCLWLTQTGDSRDHLLHAGQSHAFTQRGKVLVTAMMDSRLQLIAEPKRAGSISFWQAQVAWARRYFQTLNRQLTDTDKLTGHGNK